MRPPVTAADRADWLAWAGARADAAWLRAQDALAMGTTAEARRWLERAHRLAPADPTVAITLGGLLIQAEDFVRAEALLRPIAEAQDVLPAWIGLAACALRLGRPADAADALGRALSRHAPGTGLAALAETVARATGLPGWVGANAAGAVTATAGATLALDGARLPGRRRTLPRGWRQARELQATLDGVALLGSPVQLRVVGRVEGFVAAEAGGLAGWAWHPADPDADPALLVQGTGSSVPVVATQPAAGLSGLGAFARPRRFRVPAAALPDGMLRVLGADGRDLLGSPLDPGLERRAAAALRGGGGDLAAAPLWADFVGAAPAVTRRATAADVVVPAYRDAPRTLACLDSVLATLPRGARLHVVDDASPEPELSAALDRLAARGRIRLLRNARNLGFPGSANAGLRACSGRDAVLLNADTLVAPGWLEALREAAHSDPAIGSATPLSNDATLCSFPDLERPNPVPDLAATRRLARLAALANPGATVEIPTAHGFCMYLRRDCLDAVGLLREDAFAQGYGEENDWCLRARQAGWRHVAVPGVFVGHVGASSFGAARGHLIARNLAVLNRLHPGYDALIAAHGEADPLFEARRRLDAARFRAARRPGSRSALLLTHGGGGGVERVVAERCAAHAAQGLRPIVLRPAADACVVGDPPDASDLNARAGGGYPNLRYRLPDELPALVRLLRGERPVLAELHHLLGHHHDVLDLVRALDVPMDAFVHDYAWFCQRVALVGPQRRYCGEPDVAGCEACIADAGSNLEEDISVPALLVRSAEDLAAARTVVAPSADAAARLRRHFPMLRPLVRPWEAPRDLPPPRTPRLLLAAGERHVAVVGAIGVEKGFDVLLACVRDAAQRRLSLRFTVVGTTIDDARLMAAGPAFVTGEYREDEAEALIRAQDADLAFLPSVWPETWCFTLTHAWRAGLAVAVFDLGAPAERIRATGRGWLLPFGLAAPAVNAALLAASAPALRGLG